MLKYINPINWKLWQKMLIIIIVMGGVIIVGLNQLLPLHNDTINFSQKELDGCKYVDPLHKLLSNAAKYRVLSVSALSGDETTKNALASIEANIDANLKDLDTQEQAKGSEGKALGLSLQTTDKFNRLKQSWEATKSRAINQETIEQRGKFVTDIVGLITTVGDNSNLILDPDLDTFYLMVTLLYDGPKMTEELNSLKELSINVASRKAITSAEKQKMAILVGKVQLSYETVKRSMTVAFQNKDVSTKLTPLLNAYDREISAFLQSIDQNFLKPETVTIDLKQLSATTDKLFDDSESYYKGLVDNLVSLINIRVNKYVSNKNIALVSIAIGSFIGLLIIAAISFLLSKQVNTLLNAFEEIKGGAYKTRVKQNSDDELGTISKSLNVTLDTIESLIQSRDERDKIQRSIRKLLEEVSTVADGDLTVEAEVSEDMTGAIADSFNFMITELRRIIGDVQEVAVQVSSAADEIQSTMKSLAQGSEAQSVQISDTSSAIDDMASSIKQVADTAGASSNVAEDAMKTAQVGAKSVEKTIRSMDGIREQVQRTAKRIKRLGESSQEIGEIVQLIRDIADRTSILALNASIQAAMAGEAGRGFAVVAEEVERLADRSTEATKRIEALIKSIQTETNETVVAMEDMTREVVTGSEIANEAGKSLEEIQNVSKRLAELIQTISLSAKQQARTSDSLAKAVSDISTGTQQSAAGTKQAAVSISNLAGLAEGLLSSVSTFKISSDGK